MTRIRFPTQKENEMKAHLIDDELYIIPETDFEEEWIGDFEPGEATKKHGMTPADLIGIRVSRKKEFCAPVIPDSVG